MKSSEPGDLPEARHGKNRKCDTDPAGRKSRNKPALLHRHARFLDWDADTMISVSRDGKSIMLCERAQGQPGTWLWIGVEDADAFFAEFSSKGAHVKSPPRNFSRAYEFEVEDPDGHVLRFGSEPKTGSADGTNATR